MSDLEQQLAKVKVYQHMLDASFANIRSKKSEAYRTGGIILKPEDTDMTHTDTVLLSVEMDKMVQKIKNARVAMRPIPKRKLLPRQHELSVGAGRLIYQSRFKKDSKTPTIRTAKGLREELTDAAISSIVQEEMIAAGKDPRDEWDEVTIKDFTVPYGFAFETERMGVKDWLPLNSKPTMYIATIEKRTPDWAAEMGFEIRKVITMRRTAEKGAFEMKIMHTYTNNVWMVTHHETGGGKFSFFGRTWPQAKAMLDRSVKSRVMDVLSDV